SDHAITVSDGDITLNCADDAIHANATEITSGTSTTIDTSDGSGMVTISGGSINASSDDDGIHADVDLTIGSTNQATEEPTVAIGYALEGLEGATVSVYSGTIDLYTSDDGINAANSTLGSNSNAYPFLLTIEGGSILVNATATGTDDEGSRASGGDGLDSNGSIIMSGGTVEVYAGSNDNGAVDYGDLNSDGWTQTGGTIAAFGSSMSVAPTSGSQAYVVFGGGNGGGTPDGTPGGTPGGGFRPFSSEDSSSLDAQSNTLSATATARTPSSGTTGTGSGSISISSGDTIGIYSSSNASSPLSTYTTKASASYLIYSSPELASGTNYTLASVTSQGTSSGSTGNDSQGQGATDGESNSGGTTEETNSDQSSATSTVAMYRLYNPNSGEHFYTASTTERANLVKLGWKAEGIGWQAPQSGNAVYRLYNPNGGDHHYTASASERDWLVSLGWNYEGIGWYSDENKTTPLYRLYNPNAKTGSHHYTTSAAEANNLVELGWNYEGIGWYGA
ncbi:MAG: carbohydrate-binding domain-containing protein, partial [Eggerthellaceae bacterium]|nr:carbohydrate-binding domain-containing protein [Eggerthellaceae bacterium]